MKISPIIVVPYRDRKDHLSQFIPHMRAFLPDAKIVIVEQADDKPFNRAKLLNIGFIEVPGEYYVFHDVDMLPVNVDYTTTIGVTQLASSEIQIRNYLGGVTMFDAETFKKVGGYNNEYFHRAEDNEMRFNLQKLKIPVLELHGEYKTLPHLNSSPSFIAALWYKAQQKRKVQDQLSCCNYKIISREEVKKPDVYTHIKVEL